MKKTIITLLAGATLLLFSCGESTKNNMNDAKELEGIKALLIENFGEDREIYQLDLDATDHLTSELGTARIDYLDNGVIYSRMYVADLVTGEKLQEPKKATDGIQSDFFTKKLQGKVKIKDLDFNLIATKYKEACALIPSDYENAILYSWYYKVNNDNEITADFALEATLKGEGTSVEGRNIVTTYYEFIFSMDKEGNITLEMEE